MELNVRFTKVGTGQEKRHQTYEASVEQGTFKFIGVGDSPDKAMEALFKELSYAASKGHTATRLAYITSGYTIV